MVLIISQETDESTNEVIKWLKYFETPFFRFNGSYLSNNSRLSFEITGRNTRKLKGLPFNPEDTKVVWYRRWDGYRNIEMDHIMNDPDIDLSLKRYAEDEYKNVSYNIFSTLEHCYWLSKPIKHRINDKAYILKLAQRHKLNVPRTFVINNKKDIRVLLAEGINLITKSMSNAKTIKIQSSSYIPYTKTIYQNDLQKMPSYFSPTLFQEKVEKKYEIRIFYLDKSFYSMAIFSQQDEKTQTDFRHYNHQKPNRFIPYQLNSNIRNKLQNLLDELKIQTCSIDLIKGIDDEYYFLEINLIGQFGMTSHPCNYNLEKIMAEFLTKKLKSFNKYEPIPC
jgi:ATP-GRASP peptide maturase of grasp-with-spasm system